ncbi:MAG: DUF1552 domain-containing protein [Deltaproteobacteria bacterium]|jgi:hypothetical protein|nr:DUF1552 domain-containing protein [Deltaproteobacteria bacterium]
MTRRPPLPSPGGPPIGTARTPALARGRSLRPPQPLGPGSRAWTLDRRAFLRGLGGSALGLAAAGGLLAPRSAHALVPARRILFFYFPDGVAGASDSGEASAWHCTGAGSGFNLGPLLSPLERYKSRGLFFNNLSMGGTDAGSHPGGAKKLLTAADYGNNESIDQYLSRTVGASSPWRHLYLGVHATLSGASGDKHIAYPTAGSSMTPEDDPRRAFASLFGSGGGSGSGDLGESPADPTEVSVIDGMLDDMNQLRAQLGSLEQAKLDVHLAALRELELRIKGTSSGGGGLDVDCGAPSLDLSGISDASLSDPGHFPRVLTAQSQLAVLAMACGLTKVATIQNSVHTSELIMSRFEGSEMYDPSYDMRSHQASHYGSRHDESAREYRAFAQQRRWWVSQFAATLDLLDAIPEESGTMLDHTIAVLCTEVCDGNNHLHDNMPFVVIGGGAGALRQGRLVDARGARHGDLWVALGQAMGADLTRFGDASSGPLGDVLA